MTEDLKELIGSLRSHDVQFLVVGSVALALYARPRYTEDLDLWVRRTEENVARLARALENFGLPVRRDSLNDFMQKDRQMITLGAAPQAVDLLNFLDGVTFEAAWENRSTADLWGETAPFIGKADLVQSKRATGRSKDLADLALLEEAHGKQR